jgi:hypothetical protein
LLDFNDSLDRNVVREKGDKEFRNLKNWIRGIAWLQEYEAKLSGPQFLHQ